MSQARTKIEIDDSPFVRSHMKGPKGYGSWAFSLERNPRDVCKDVVFTPAMTYSDAKVWIKAWFRDQQAAGQFPSPGNLGYVEIYAQP
jgi:hypothetical protein